MKKKNGGGRSNIMEGGNVQSEELEALKAIYAVSVV